MTGMWKGKQIPRLPDWRKRPCNTPFMMEALASRLMLAADPQLPRLYFANEPAVSEGNEGTTDCIFEIRLDQAASTPVTVDYHTVDGTAQAGSDYLPTSGSLTFPPGQISRQVTVQVLGDTLREYSEYFFLKME